MTVPEQHAVRLRGEAIDIREAMRRDDRLSPSANEARRLLDIHTAAMSLAQIGVAVADTCKLTPFELDDYEKTARKEANPLQAYQREDDWDWFEGEKDE